ncbi:MAG: hypothetical protein M3R63_04880 [Actinomycetota bacterium]|nr:hypothetical protein [Actinomycetota bacterium]
MGEGFGTDPAAMAGFASTLHTAATDLAALGDSLPDMPDAGEVSADMASVLSHLTAVVAELVTGVTAAGDSVSAGGSDYAEGEDVSRRSFDIETG